MTIITPDGELRHVGIDSKAAEDINLFWACRDGGGGNFGIVTEMKIRVRKPYSEKMLVGQIRFPLEQAEEVLGYYNDWVEKIPNTMAVYGFMGNQKVDPHNYFNFQQGVGSPFNPPNPPLRDISPLNRTQVMPKNI
jgi:hypothetical protein